MRIEAPFLRGSLTRGTGNQAVLQARIAAQKQVRQGMAHQVISRGIEATRAAHARYSRIAERRFKVNTGTVFDAVG